MNFLTTIIDAMVTFVRRNPLTVLIIAFLALAAPSLLQGIAEFILYAVVGMIALVIILVLVFRWKIYRMQKQIKEQFENGGARGFGGDFSGRGFGANRGGGASSAERRDAEGHVSIDPDSCVQHKRVADDVGEYVEFEEIKDEKQEGTSC